MLCASAFFVDTPRVRKSQGVCCDAKKERLVHRLISRFSVTCAGDCCGECTFNVRREENETGLTPTIANLSAGHVLRKHNGKEGLTVLRLIHLFCIWWRNVFGALLA